MGRFLRGHGILQLLVQGGHKSMGVSKASTASNPKVCFGLESLRKRVCYLGLYPLERLLPPILFTYEGALSVLALLSHVQVDAGECSS